MTVSARPNADADRLIAETRNFESFRTAVQPLNARRQGSAFERLTQLYLQTQPEYQSKLRHIWRWGEVPDEVRSRLRLPAVDEGIDLLAETYGGDLWAIQCKFHNDPNRAVTRKELGTFVALASVAGLSQRVVVHTSSRPIRKRALLGNTVVEVGLDRWLAIDEQSWSLIGAAVRGRPATPEPRLPRSHQQEAIIAATRHYLERGATRGRLIMPCGTGKSLTAFWIAEALDAREILVAVPSLALIRQSLADWTREYLARGEAPEWLCVCGDESVGTLHTDSFVAETYDLGIPTTTDQEEIATFLSKPVTGRRITFTTYQSSGRLAEAARDAGAAFDLAVLDEAHRTVGVASKTFATLLRDECVNIQRRLFMTATERVLRGKNDDVLSMDDEAVYGERFHQLTFKDAIAQGIISDYRILTIAVSDERVQETIRQNRFLDLGPEDEEAEAQAVAAGITLKRVFQEHGISHAISFHRSIRAADRFREQQDRLDDLTEVGPATTNLHISSKKTAGQRAELLREFVSHDRALMTNARCLTEGVDIPAIDGVLFADPKRSVVDIVQAAGRALRKLPGKDCGYILLPLIVPSDVDLEAFADSTAFRQIARTITALSTQDERIAEEFRAVLRSPKPSGRITEIEGDVPVGLNLDLDRFAAAIRARVWQRVGRANWRSFDEAREYVRELGLRNQRDWSRYAASPLRPPDIPTDPKVIYSGRGWKGLGDWLGTGRIADHNRVYRNFEEARSFARSLGISSVLEWWDFAKSGAKPDDIPALPRQTYLQRGWSGWGDWLGTHRIATNKRQYREFHDARAFVRSLGLKDQKGWEQACNEGRIPPDIPRNAWKTYRGKGWLGFGDWLGTAVVSNAKKNFLPFEKARQFVRGLGLKDTNEWLAYARSSKRPSNIPVSPASAYANAGWSSMGDWLGTGTVANMKRRFRPFAEARQFVHEFNLKSVDEWKAYSLSGKRPADIPSNPSRTYEADWISFGDWLGTDTIAPSRRKFLPFLEARRLIQGLGIRSREEWYEYIRSARRDPRLPSNPNQNYAAEGWSGWVDWLGLGSTETANQSYRAFDDARQFVRLLRLSSHADWRRYVKSGAKPSDIPAAPSHIYRYSGWKSMADWLGTIEGDWITSQTARVKREAGIATDADR